MSKMSENTHLQILVLETHRNPIRLMKRKNKPIELAQISDGGHRACGEVC
jgi:hypothetical protein